MIVLYGFVFVWDLVRWVYGGASHVANGVVSVALCFFIVYVGLRCVFDFPQIGFCLGLAQKGSAGVGGEASFMLYVGSISALDFPTNRTFVCNGSRMGLWG